MSNALALRKGMTSTASKAMLWLGVVSTFGEVLPLLPGDDWLSAVLFFGAGAAHVAKNGIPEPPDF